jgi:hypothetical protein
VAGTLILVSLLTQSSLALFVLIFLISTDCSSRRLKDNNSCLMTMLVLALTGGDGSIDVS